MLEGAVLAAEEAGFLGVDVLGSGHRVAVTVRPVQGSYMLGEETVLLKALEGRRGQPEQQPPYPTERGLWDKPTVIDNVQTLAAVPWIIREGADRFAAIGGTTGEVGGSGGADSGTVLVQLRGPAGAGIAEVPLGTPLRVAGGPRRRQSAAGRSRRSSSAAPPAASSLRTSWTPRTPSTRCARPAPRSGPAPW